MPVVGQINEGGFDVAPAEAIIENTTSDIEEYTYHEYDDGQNIVRVYDTHELAPTVTKKFCKPNGYVFTLTLEEEKINTMFALMETVANADFGYINYTVNYFTYDTEVYVESFNNWFEGDPSDHAAAAEFFKGFMTNNINGLTLFKTEEVFVRADISAIFDLTFCDSDYQYYKFKFYSDSLNIEPFDSGGFITPYTFYEDNGMGRTRINVRCSLIDGFFDHPIIRNPYGFDTDEKRDTYYYDPETGMFEMIQVAKADITVVAYGSLPLGSFDYEMSLDILTFPKESIPVKLRLDFTSGGKAYSYYSPEFILGNPNLSMVIDDDVERNSVERNSNHSYHLKSKTVDFNSLVNMQANVATYPIRLNDPFYGVNLFDKVLPTKGEEGKYYYIPSDREITLHNQGRDDLYLDDPAEGKYYIWKNDVMDYEEYYVFELMSSSYDIEENGEFDYDKYAVVNARMPFVGKWAFTIMLEAHSLHDQWHINTDSQAFEVVAPGSTEDVITLNMPDDINLLVNAGEIEIIPAISSYNSEYSYYYDWEVSRSGVIEIEEKEDGKLVVNPINSGLVSLKLEIESNVFSRISKTVSIRVLDAIYDVSKIQVADEFHQAGKDLTVSLGIRGFTEIQNISIDWKVVNKKEVELPEDRIVVHNNATMTLINPEADDYTITAFYQGVELDKITIQFRYVDMNKFLKQHIWWIVLITFGFIALVILVILATKRGKTTVQRIERVYQVYCQCISNDTLSVSELKTIKREISTCLHHVEDLNIDAFNQYEKATRYLRKSLIDTKTLLVKYDELTPEEKGVMYERLDKDLSKALIVAKEIENAKELIEAYHNQANRHNFEEIKKEKPEKKKKE